MNETLSEIFTNVGKTYGFVSAVADWTISEEVSYTIHTHSRKVFWDIPDCFKYAPALILTDLAFTYYDVAVLHRPTMYSREAVDYLTSQEYISRGREAWLQSHKAVGAPVTHIQGVPVYVGDVPSGDVVYSRPFGVIAVHDASEIKSLANLNFLCMFVSEYANELRHRIFNDRDHADCRHCRSPNRKECR